MFYTYCYIDPSQPDPRGRLPGAPFYVGKGKGSRDKDQFKPRRKCRSSTQRHIWSLADEGVTAQVIRVADGVDEELAFLVEKELISLYGRRDTATGILFNGTDGGEGTAGAVRNEETRKRISKAKTGKPLGEDAKRKMSITLKERGMPKAAMEAARLANTGRPIKQAVRDHLSKKLTGFIYPKMTCICCKKVGAGPRMHLHIKKCKEKTNG